MKKVNFYLNNKIRVPNKRHLKQYLIDLFESEGKSLLLLNIIGLSDEELFVMNRSFLQHEYYTDIITFDLSDNPDNISGELYISIDRVMENAKNLSNFLLPEFYRVLFHGCLHLCGYNDKKPNEKKQMTIKENSHLDEYAICVSRGT
ncbi:rRNA maturation RNase YbeY [soil metagenome]